MDIHSPSGLRHQCALAGPCCQDESGPVTAPGGGDNGARPEAAGRMGRAFCGSAAASKKDSVLTATPSHNAVVYPPVKSKSTPAAVVPVNAPIWWLK